MKKPNMKKEELNKELLSSYEHWKDLYENGGKDPFYFDGTNLNLVHNHIRYYKLKLEELLEDNFLAYPESYFIPEPPLLPEGFLVKPRKVLNDWVFAEYPVMTYTSLVEQVSEWVASHPDPMTLKESEIYEELYPDLLQNLRQSTEPCSGR